MRNLVFFLSAVFFCFTNSAFAYGTIDETCEISGTGTLECRPGEECSWTGSSPAGCVDMSGDDLIRITDGVATLGPAGVHAEPSDSSGCTSCGIEVEDGAVLSQIVPAGSAKAISAYVSRLGVMGLHCKEGSNCNLIGKVLDGYGTTEVTLSDTLPSLGPIVGEMVPCPNTETSECPGTNAAGIDDTLRIEWPESAYGPWDGEGATNLDDFLEAIEIGSDYICSYRFDEYGPAPRYLPGWLNQCYQVTGVSLPTADPLWLEINVLQGEADAEIQPLSRRMIFQGMLDSDVSAGGDGRTFYLSEGTLPSSPSPGTDWDRMWMDGAWLYFERSQTDTDGCVAADRCQPERRGYRLMDARPDDTCEPGNLSAGSRCSSDSDCDQATSGDGLGSCIDGDLVTIADENGAEIPHLSGTTVWVGLGLGFAEGDRFAVVRPSKIASSENDKTDAPTALHFGGQMTVQFAHFDNPGDLLLTSCPTLWEYIRVTDSMGGTVTGGNSDALFDGALSEDCHTWGPTTFTGTDPRSTTAMENVEHGISMEAAGGLNHRQAHTFHDWALRYHNDDCVDIHNPSGQFITEMRFTGLFTCEYIGQGDSAVLLDGHGGSWCDTGNQNAESGCEVDSDCDLSVLGDGLGACVDAPQSFSVEAASCVNCAVDDRTSLDDLGSALCEGGPNFGGVQKSIVSIGGMISPGAPCNFEDLTFLGGETDENNGIWLRRADGLVVREVAALEGSRVLSLSGISEDSGHLKNAYLHSNPDLNSVRVTGDGVEIENVALINEQGPADVTIANRYSNTTLQDITIVGQQSFGDHRMAAAESALGSEIVIGAILLVNDSSRSAVQRMTDEGMGFDQPNIEYNGSFCLHNIENGFFNSTDEQDLIDAGMPVVYLEDPEFEIGSWSLVAGGAADTNECGALPGLDSPGIHFANDALLVNKLEPECIATQCKRERGEVTCGDSSLDALEECDDGNLNSGDGCSERCTHEYSLTLQDLSHDGWVRLWVESIPVGVEATAGQSAEDVAEAIAVAINSHQGLQERGIEALASGDRVISDAQLDVITLDGLGGIEILVSLAMLGYLRQRRHNRIS